MTSVDFQRLVRDMLNISPTMRIQLKGTQVIFPTNGDFASQETILETDTATKEEIDSSFSLKFLSLFSKASALSNTVSIFMRANNFPLICAYSIGNIGIPKLVLSAKLSNM